MKNFRLIIIWVMLLVWIPTGNVFAQYFFAESDLVGKPSPDFTLDTVNQEQVNFSEFRDGQKAIIFFWATWCPHCLVQIKEMNSQKEKFENEKIKIVLIDLGENKKQVQRFLKRNKIEFNVFLDKKSELESKYQIIGVPTLYFVNEEGKVTGMRHSLPDDYQTFLSKR